MNKTIFSIQNSFGSSVNYLHTTLTPSAFGVPEKFTVALDQKIKESRYIRNYLQFLLNKYRIIAYSGVLPRGNGIKTRYQEKNQNLQYYKFRPRCSDWIELKMLSLAHGVSMTHFFVFLLEMDTTSLGEDILKFYEGIVPTVFLGDKPIRLGIHLNRHRAEKQIRIKFGKSQYIFDDWASKFVEMFGKPAEEHTDS